MPGCLRGQVSLPACPGEWPGMYEGGNSLGQEDKEPRFKHRSVATESTLEERKGWGRPGNHQSSILGRGTLK